MNTIGEDCPTLDDIDYYGLFYACQRTNGNFALYDETKKLAARGRIGTSTLYWNGKDGDFSFRSFTDAYEFPTGHLYDGKRLVCWDPLYYDKPMSTPVNEARETIQKLLKKIIHELEYKVDAVLFSASDGSVLISEYLKNDDDLQHYTHVTTVDEDEENTFTNQEFRHTLVFTDDFAKFLKERTHHKKFMCGYGLDNLISGDFSNASDYTKSFTSHGLEVYSPFCDFRIVNYVLDCTDPKDRKKLLSQVISSDDDDDDPW